MKMWSATSAGFVLSACVGTATAVDFTLPDSVILALKTNQNPALLPLTATAAASDVPGPGVRFDIHFPGSYLPNNYLLMVADPNQEKIPMPALDFTSYANFALKFTVLSIDGSATGNGT